MLIVPFAVNNIPFLAGRTSTRTGGSTGHPAAGGAVLRLQRGGHRGRRDGRPGVQVRGTELHRGHREQEERREIERIPVRE